MTTEFVLLGAGFSRALSNSMPLLRDLGKLVLNDLKQNQEVLRPFDSNLEQWLSYLSVDQPWLSDSNNMRNRALFDDASRSVQKCIADAEIEALSHPPKTWAARLVWDWCNRGCDIATFNYDLL